jgi:hypothetical protein
VGLLEESVEQCIAAAGGDLAKLSVELEAYLRTFDRLTPLLGDTGGGGDPDEAMVDLLDQTREDLIEAYLAFALNRRKLAFMALRGVMEGLFSALYYRYQSISRTLWARDASFQMVHQLLAMNSANEFYLYFKPLFDDPSYKSLYKGCSAKSVFTQGDDLYARLSRFIHKKFGPSSGDFSESVAEVFRLFLTFLDRTDDDLTAIDFPAPMTWAEHKFGKTT